MSVALATMDSAYGLNRLGMTSHHHHLAHQFHQLHHRRACSPDSHVADRREDEHPSDGSSNSALRFSVVNILRPEFGRDAILSTRSSTPKQMPIKVTALPIHSPLQPRDLSLSSSRLSPHSPPVSAFTQRDSNSRDAFSTHSGLASPIQRHSSSNLSRSGSLESLASSRSSVAGSSVNGAASVSSAASTTDSVSGESNSNSSVATANSGNGQSLWPAWIYCTRYSDRPSSGPRTRRVKRTSSEKSPSTSDEKRPRTAFSAEQLARLKREFTENRYLTEPRRQKLSKELGLNEQQIKIWFQNKRAKIKKASGQKNPLALQLMAQGLYNHSTVPVDEDGEEIPMPAAQE